MQYGEQCCPSNLSPVQLPVYCVSVKYIIAEVRFHSLCCDKFCVAFGKATASRTEGGEGNKPWW